MEDKNLILTKSKMFAVRIIKLSDYISVTKKQYVISKQLLRSGTGIGSNVHEAKYAQSDADFINKLSVALKEASETEYWLDILYETEYLTEDEYKSISHDCKELCKLLISIIVTCKNKQSK